MDTAELQTKYDAWKEKAGYKKGLEDGAKNILSGEPQARGLARLNLERILNIDSPGLIDSNTDSNRVLSHVPTAMQVYDEQAFLNIKLAPQEFVNKAYTEKKDNFSKNYMEIAPYVFEIKDGKPTPKLIETKDKNTDEAIKDHGSYYSLNEIIKSYESKSGKDPRSALEFAGNVGEEVAKELMLSMTSEGASEKTAQRRVALAMEVYAGEPQRMYVLALNARGKAQKRLESRFGDDNKKAEYAKKLLDAKASGGEDVRYSGLSEDLYKIVG